VQISFAEDRTRMNIARHNLSGVNRFGQNAAEFPFCMVNLAAWKDCPFDLRLANWFRTCDEAIQYAGGRSEAPSEKPPESKVWSAAFAGGVQVELRHQQGGRWLMWVAQNDKLERQKGFATPYVEHAKMTAEHWYGAPVGGWTATALSQEEGSV
jgi:hypothetical protein